MGAYQVLANNTNAGGKLTMNTETDLTVTVFLIYQIIDLPLL